MLCEFALTPGVFEVTSYDSATTCDVCLQMVRQPLLEEALVRDLRDGGWSAFARQNVTRFHPKAKELLTKLIRSNRLRRMNACLAVDPGDDEGWCNEAIASGDTAGEALHGIITTPATKVVHAADARVASIDRLGYTTWWNDRQGSSRPNRSIESYLAQLRLPLLYANRMMFIDPHLDPESRNYRDFHRIIRAVRRTTPLPRIEFHRVCYEGGGPSRTFPNWRDHFKGLDDVLREVGLAGDVFIWDDFHDRYLITDLVGINLPWGFDTSTNASTLTTWTRLTRSARENVEREFEENAGRHKLRDRFSIG